MKRVPCATFFVTIALLAFISAYGVQMQTFHGHAISGFQKLRSFVSITLEQCGDYCTETSRCRSLQYHVPTRSCLLGLTTPYAGELIPQSGFVTMVGFEPKETCGDSSVCDEEKDCYAGSNCRIGGCGPPGNIINQTILGNMYNIGSVLMIVTLETKITQVFCQSDGTWHYDFTSVCADTSVQRGIQFCDHVTDGGRWIVRSEDTFFYFYCNSITDCMPEQICNDLILNMFILKVK